MFYTADSLRQMHQGGETVDFLFFYGHQLPSDGSATESCLSQWYPCIFEADGILYQSMEQYMMAQKAAYFGDYRTHARILSACTPGGLQSLGTHGIRLSGGELAPGPVNRSYCAEIFKNFCRIPL